MGVLENILSWADNKRKVATKNVKDFASNPADFLSMVQGRVAESNKKMASGDIEEVMNSVDPFGGVSGAAGMIRRGGRPDINLVHNIGTGFQDLLNLINRRGASISSPSIAIAKDTIYPFATSPTLVMNPVSSRFDPAVNPLNQLINRDMYATRAKAPSHRVTPVMFDEYAGNNRFNADPSTLRLRQGADARFTEGGGPPEASHVAAIMASERFPGFARYEQNAGGYGALINADDVMASEKVLKESSRRGHNYSQWLADQMPFQPSDAVPGQPVTGSIRNPENFKWLLKKVSEGDKEALAILRDLRTAPSDYAELKVVGEVGLNPKHVSAMVIPEHVDSRWFPSYELQQFADKTGIRTGKPSQLMPLEDQYRYMDLAELISGKLDSGASSAENFKKIPDSVKKYVGSPMMLGKTDPESLFKTMTYSNQFAADTASILTARDLDEAAITSNVLKNLRERGSQ